MRVFQQLRSLFRSEDGSSLPVIAFSAIAMVAAGGAAIDMGRAQLVQAKLSNALDSAGLAAGASASTANISTEAEKYFNLNFPTGYMGATVTSFSATPNADNSQIALSATAVLPTTLMKIVSINSVTLTATSNVVRANKGLELALVLDVTGSMNCPVSGTCYSTSSEQTNSKIAALRSAGASLVNILYGSETSIDNLWIGIVPFSQAVNIGTSRSSWTDSTSYNWGLTSWGGCVTARWANGNDITETPPSSVLFGKYFNPCESGNGWYGTNGSRSNCSTGSGWQYKSSPSNTTHGPNRGCPSAAITPMGRNKSTTLSAISSLTANGSTEIPLGLAWGWRMLSPLWRGQWGGQMNTDQLPLDYHTPLMNKALILMTDGDNDISYNNYTAYGHPNDGGLGASACNVSTGNCTNGETSLNTKTSTLCSSMKAADKDIVIYTVAFGSGISTNTQTMLRNCASKPEYFFLSPTSESLQTAFQQIGDSLANLRISQ